MKLKPYSSYKSSGVKWLGEVPEHWEIKSLKSILLERIEKNDPIKTTNILSLMINRGVVPYSERGGGGNKAKEDISSYKLAYKNDIVLNSMNVVVGAVGLSKYFGAVSPVYYMLYPRKKEDKVEYFSNIFQSQTFQRSLLGLGNGILMKESESSNKLNTIRMRIPMDKLNIQVLPYPSAVEQEMIVSFLDHSTLKLDTLIAKQEKLIELLKEKRQAIISHAVTKGLDPNVKMKESGSEFLGEVPECWDVFKVRRCLIEHRQGYYPTDPYTESGVKLLRITDLREYAGVEFSEAPYVELKEDISPFLLKRNDFVFARTGGAGLFGVIGDVDIPVIYASYLIRFRFTSGIETDFLKYYFLSSKFQESLKQNIHGGVNQNVHAEDIKNQYLALPEKLEQIKIVNFLNKQVSKVDSLISKAELSITLAKEHRTALISAAVTGKIDVRDIV